MKALLLFTLSFPLAAQWTIVDNVAQGGGLANNCYMASAVSDSTAGRTFTTALANNCSPAKAYTSGRAQWTSLSFQYGTVTIRAAMPAQNTNTWPALWFKGANCQPSGSTCPAWTQAGGGYAEVDMVECVPFGNWCQLNSYWNGGQASPACAFSVDSNMHTWVMTWTSSALHLSKDGTDIGCSVTTAVPQAPMFMILQTATANSPLATNLPAAMTVASVKVQDSNGQVIFYTDFHSGLIQASSLKGALIQ